MLQPRHPFTNFRIAEPCFHAYRQTACLCCLDNVTCNIPATDQTTSLSFCCHIGGWTSHIDIDAPETFFLHAKTHLTEIFRFIAPNMRDHRLFIFSKCQTSTDTELSLGMTVTLRVREFCKEYIRSRRFIYHMPEKDIGDVFRWC